MVKLVKENIVLIAILIVALFLRTYRLDYLELFGDELDAGYQSYSLLINGTDYKGNFLPTYMHSFSEWRAPALMYAMVPFIKLFGLNEWGVRVGPAVFGVLSIFGFYLLLMQLKIDKKVGLLTVFLLSITPWHIQYSRSGFEITLLSCLIIFGLYFLIRKNFVISAMLLSLSLYTYSSANILMPLLVFLTLYFYKIDLKSFIKFVLFGLLFSLPIIYQLFFGHVADRFGTMSLLGNKDVIAEVNDFRNGANQTFVSKIFYNKYVVAAKKMLFNYSNAFGGNFLFNEGDVTFRHSLHQVGNLFWIELPLIIIGLVFVLKQSKYHWMIGFLLIAPIASSLTIDGYNHATRLFFMVFPLTFFAAYGFYCLPKYKLLFVLILVFEFCRFQYYYWNFYRDQSWRWWHTGYKQSMQFIANNKEKYSKVIMDNTYEPSLIRFLFWNQFDSRQVFDLKDSGNFCIEDKFCFVNFGNRFDESKMQSNVLYMVSHDRNGFGAPTGVRVLKVISNYYGVPIFYLVERE